MQQLIEWMATPINRSDEVISAIGKAKQLLAVEKSQLMRMYMEGRECRHLDDFHANDANDAYNDYFGNKQSNPL